jgi:hypothetical protein
MITPGLLHFYGHHALPPRHDLSGEEMLKSFQNTTSTFSLVSFANTPGLHRLSSIYRGELCSQQQPPLARHPFPPTLRSTCSDFVVWPYREHRTLGMPHNAISCTAKEHMFDTAVTVCSNDDEIDPLLFCLAQDLLMRVAGPYGP